VEPFFEAVRQPAQIVGPLDVNGIAAVLGLHPRFGQNGSLKFRQLFFACLDVDLEILEVEHILLEQLIQQRDVLQQLVPRLVEMTGDPVDLGAERLVFGHEPLDPVEQAADQGQGCQEARPFGQAVDLDRLHVQEEIGEHVADHPGILGPHLAEHLVGKMRDLALNVHAVSKDGLVLAQIGLAFDRVDPLPVMRGQLHGLFRRLGHSGGLWFHGVHLLIHEWPPAAGGGGSAGASFGACSWSGSGFGHAAFSSSMTSWRIPSSWGINRALDSSMASWTSWVMTRNVLPPVGVR